MEANKHPYPWLALLGRPAFCVKDGLVTDTNNAAWFRSIQIGMPVQEIINEHWDTYNSFREGTLFLSATVDEIPYDITIIRTEEYDIFIMEQDEESESLRALALAAQQLRIPLSNVMTVSDRLQASLGDKDTQVGLQSSQINRGLYQLLRIVSNMSDAASQQKAPFAGMQMVNISSVFQETMEKITATVEGITIRYDGPDRPVLGLADGEKLERAIYNILSNAVKFALPDSVVDAKLTKKGDQLSFTVCNTQAEEPENQRFWNRYCRVPTMEDGRYGLGLGMVLVSRIAACHGGTVLIDHPEDKMTRVMMTVSIRKDDSGNVRSPVMRIGDYAGGRDKALLEFAEILPAEAYQNEN